MVTDPLTDLLAVARVMAILRTPHAVAVAHLLAEHGFGLCEVPLTAPGALDAIAEIGGPVGAGTVLTAAQAADAVAAGATFLVTPAVLPDVQAAADRLGLPVLAGAYTPTEVLAAHRLGAAAVKLFPAATGGPAHLSALRAPFPDIPLIPVGGIAVTDVPAYLAAGALAVGLGTPLIGDGTDRAGIAQRAAALRRALP